MQYVLTEKRSTTLGKPLILWENYSIILKYNVYAYQYFKPLFSRFYEMEFTESNKSSQNHETKVSFFGQCSKMQLIPLQNFNNQTCFI